MWIAYNYNRSGRHRVTGTCKDLLWEAQTHTKISSVSWLRKSPRASRLSGGSPSLFGSNCHFPFGSRTCIPVTCPVILPVCCSGEIEKFLSSFSIQICVELLLIMSSSCISLIQMNECVLVASIWLIQGTQK